MESTSAQAGGGVLSGANLPTCVTALTHSQRDHANKQTYNNTGYITGRRSQELTIILDSTLILYLTADLSPFLYFPVFQLNFSKAGWGRSLGYHIIIVISIVYTDSSLYCPTVEPPNSAPLKFFYPSALLLLLLVYLDYA